MPCLYTPYQYAHAYDDCNSTCTHAPLPMLMWFHDAELAAQEEKGQKRKHEQERGDEDVGPSGRVGEGGGMALEEKGKRKKKKMKVEAVDVLVASTQVAEASVRKKRQSSKGGKAMSRRKPGGRLERWPRRRPGGRLLLLQRPMFPPLPRLKNQRLPPHPPPHHQHPPQHLPPVAVDNGGPPLSLGSTWSASSPSSRIG